MSKAGDTDFFFAKHRHHHNNQLFFFDLDLKFVALFNFKINSKTFSVENQPPKAIFFRLLPRVFYNMEQARAACSLDSCVLVVQNDPELEHVPGQEPMSRSLHVHYILESTFARPYLSILRTNPSAGD